MTPKQEAKMHMAQTFGKYVNEGKLDRRGLTEGTAKALGRPEYMRRGHWLWDLAADLGKMLGLK